jgi:hypothetical protein
MTSIKKPSLAETHPKLAAQALGWNPSRRNSSSRTPVRWRCPKGHHYSASIVERIKHGKSCNFCAIEIARAEAYESERIGEIVGKIVERERVKKLIESERTKNAQKRKKPEERHWAESYPEIAKQADGWDPKRIKNGSKSEKQWICARRHHFRMSVEVRVKHKGRCYKCPKWRPRSISINDLADALYVDRLKFWNFSEGVSLCQLNPKKKMSIRYAERLVDVFYDAYSTKEKLARFEVKVEKDWGNQVNLRWSVLERCSCQAMIDPSRPHECRRY